MTEKKMKMMIIMLMVMITITKRRIAKNNDDGDATKKSI